MCSRHMHLLRHEGENRDYVRSLFHEARRKMQCVLGDLFRQMAKELTWEVSGWLRAKTLLTCGSRRACGEFVLWQKNHLIGPRRRQQPNFFNAFPFTHFILITAYHPALLCNQMNRWRKVWVLSFSTLEALKSLVLLWRIEWFHLNFCFLFCISACLLFSFAKDTLPGVYLLLVTGCFFLMCWKSFQQLILEYWCSSLSASSQIRSRKLLLKHCLCKLWFRKWVVFLLRIQKMHLGCIILKSLLQWWIKRLNVFN